MAIGNLPIPAENATIARGQIYQLTGLTEATRYKFIVTSTKCPHVVIAKDEALEQVEAEGYLSGRAIGAAKLTFGIGRGAKTVRSDLSIDSYSIIPANDLAYNHGEILDITFDNVRDTQRNGYTVRVREIYALDSTAGWQVKTTTSFIPASQNEPIPWTIAKVIY